MRYCPKCDAEYRDTVERCVEDGTSLLDRPAYEAELARQGRRPIDSRHLATVALFDDRFEAEEIVEDLLDEGFHAALLATKPAVVGPLTVPSPTEWALVVPEAELEAASALVREWREALESTQAEAERAAEAEEAATEAAPPLV